MGFEILSPGNTPLELADKLAFYDEHGVEEYYLCDPDRNQLAVYLRSGKEMVVYRPDGQPFRAFEEVMAELREEWQRRQDAEQRAARLAERLRQAGLDPDA